ncbi:RNA-guided pseudouridylation complex pseudouridine synthase subunit Cbf5 [Candidatus Pacearchaeota archaeon]|nr:RNA-guided pseudouridylation complex pseudouridine synthase subunit Cbf5 [Candidatus Pacearchaeota archaeon]
MGINIEKLKKSKSTEELLEFGIINIDKPQNPTSFDTSEFVMKKLGLRKTSHFGTLDPRVTGVLPIALNRACKLTGYFIGEDKEYVGIMRMHEKVSMKKIQKVIKDKFTGVIIQKPPVKSRVKRQEREREVKKFELLEVDKNEKDILFRAEVEGGTYIRKLIDDLGKELGTGAHMLELRRVRAGIFREDNEKNKYPSINLYDFEKAVEDYKEGNDKMLRDMIIPGEIISNIYPVVQIKKKPSEKILHGKPIFHEDLEKKQEKKNKIPTGETFAGFAKEDFLGMFKVVNQKNVFAKPRFVFQPLTKKEKGKN